MPSTRRCFTSALLLGTASVGAVVRPGAAQPLLLPDLRAQLLQARASAPPAVMRANPRAEMAFERTFGRVGEVAADLAAPRLILVNIAAAEAIAFEDGREVLRSRVIVGTPRNRTPQLVTFATSVRCNPPWHVPASIIPEIRAAGGGAGFQTVGARMIQPPGPNNPLGILRLGLLDSDGIFLHGTNRPALFQREGRALSHGCVRVERIREFCAWMLDISPAALQNYVSTGRTIELHPLRDVQVVLAYFSAWPDSAGRLVIHPDPYGLDAPGARRAGFRRILRNAPDDPLEVEAAARATLAATPRI